jgi:tryptophan halogenase
MDVPDSLKHKMELFRRRARVVTYKDGLFLEPSWLAVYFGQRVMPTAWDPLGRRLDGAEVQASAAGGARTGPVDRCAHAHA